MKKITVASLPIDEVIKDLAKEFGVDCKYQCEEYILDIPESLGKGRIYGIMLDSGLGMINYEVELNEDIEIHFVKNKVHPLKFIFCYGGVITHRFQKSDTGTNVINKFQNSIVASKGNNGHILCLPAGREIKVNSIEINRQRFIEKFDCPMDELPENIQELINDAGALTEFYYSGNYSFRISDIIHNITAYSGSLFMRRLYLESKCYDLLTLQLALFIEDENDSTPILHAGELDLVEYAARYLKQNINKGLTIKELSREVGLSEAKLQNGFKRLYGKTINSFTQDYRLERACELLTNNKINVNEVLQEIGITNSSYFARVFKERYGMNPKSYQMKQEELKREQKTP